MKVDPNIFKAYDIRGIYGETITTDIAAKIADAFTNLLHPKEVIIGYDMRVSSPELASTLMNRFNSLGILVKDIGMVSTSAFYFACGSYDLPGIIVTASHNPKEYNGFKMIASQPFTISKGEGMEEMRHFVESDETLPIAVKQATTKQTSIWDAYLNKLNSFIDTDKMEPFKVVIDAANGMAGVVWEKLAGRLPISIIPLNFKPDGTFPNHEPDPKKAKNREQVENAVKEHKADMGFSFDADADRCFFIDELGSTLPSSFITALLASHFTSKQKQASVVYDVSSSWLVADEVKKLGGLPIMERVGHSFIKKTMIEKDAVLGGEASGHFYFKDFFYSDSGLIAALLILSIVSMKKETLSKIVAPWREQYKIADEIIVTVENSEALFETFKTTFADGKITEIDGLLIEYPDWKCGIRVSNTVPAVKVNIEALKDEALLETKKRAIMELLNKFI